MKDVTNNIIVGSVACFGISISFPVYGQIYARNLTRSGEERFDIPSMGHNMKAVLSHLPVDSQIHARNLKSPAERDLPYISNSG